MKAFSKDHEREPGAPSALTGRAVSDDVGNPDARCELMCRAQPSSEGALTGAKDILKGLVRRSCHFEYCLIFENLESVVRIGQSMFKVASHGKRVLKVNDPPLPTGSWRRWTSHLGAVHANPDAPKKSRRGAPLRLELSRSEMFRLRLLRPLAFRLPPGPRPCRLHGPSP